jgi:molecular chaperone GrpE (heat shock protein)
MQYLALQNIFYIDSTQKSKPDTEGPMHGAFTNHGINLISWKTKEMEMTETSQRLSAIDSIERERKANERKLKEVKAELDELETKRLRVKLELNRLRKKGWWGRLFTLYR